MPDDTARLLPEEEIASYDDYLAMGGGEGLRRALDLSPEEVAQRVLDSGLRGRGGAGFPTGMKWSSVAEAADDGSDVYLVCNAAEGEPGTYKDRLLMARNPYQLIEGVLIGMYASKAERGFIGMKEKMHHELERMGDALQAMVEAGWRGADLVTLIPGPDEYLYGEESAMLEVIEGKLPMPRILPPYQVGLFATMQSPNPTVVNNVETLSHVTHILAKGVDWFRQMGTEETPGTMVFTVLGDVENEGLFELPMGTPLRTLIEDIAGGTDVMAIHSGTSNTIITPDLLDLPMDFDSFKEAGTGLGSGGFIVYGSHRDIVQVTEVLTRFLAVESCGQCNACKIGTRELFKRLERLVQGVGTHADIEEIRKFCVTVTDLNRCYLPVGASLLVASTLEAFPQAFIDHIGVASDPAVAVMVPKIDHIDEDTGKVILDDQYYRKRRDWSYAPPGVSAEVSGTADTDTA
ncbi:MAG TPA: NADH-ubiquinone oxidoreductase-F iron-sulfur binding region domain-containing protein [Egibacteraceae bacterium]|nr:NADH-ubiquinone oxidoreductase-F iron-sulfur binding region domain-containing protein [Egibacteraceae bacterium]